MIEEKTLEQNGTEEQSSTAIILDIWNIVLLRWPWILLSVIICMAGAFAYLRYTTPTYSANAKILVKSDDNKRQRGVAGQMNLSELGIISNTDGFDNELEILKSTSISQATVKALDLNIRYFIHGRLKEQELYKTSPIVVAMNDEDSEAQEEPLFLTITPKGKGIKVDVKIKTEKAPVKTYTLNSLPGNIQTKAGILYFARQGRERLSKLPSELKVIILPYKKVATMYTKTLNVAPSSKTTTVANLSLIDTEPERALDYINQLMTSYNEDANQDKNEVATKTKEFINDRLSEIGSELSATEADLEHFKKSNELINLANDATTALQSTTNYQKEQVDIETQITLVNSLIEYVSSPQNQFQVIPSGLGIKDNLLNTQITKYNESLLQYNRLVKSGGENNPTVAKLADEINSTLLAVQQSLRNILADLRIQKRSIDNQYALFSGKISSTPTHERILNDIGRQQEIKAQLYLTLLQKREENLISLASTATKAKWLDRPFLMGKVSPKSHIILLIALILGLAIPLGIFYLIEMLRFRIEGQADVEKLTDLPLLADIPLSHKLAGSDKRAIVVSENSNNTMEECFRGLRTNVRFVLNGDEKVIQCTSAIPGEGKTFVCTNLAMSFALLGKKVIVVGLDIRKPQLVRLFNLPADKRGITNFLADEKADFKYLEEQIFNGVMNPNLDVLPAGIIPPNPGELISRTRLDDAINYLREKYDIVMLDTPPVGLVSDTLEIGRTADATLVVCRADYSLKSNFALINGMHEDKKLPKMSMVLNGVDLNKRKYGYYYGYGKYGKYGYHKYGKYGHYGHYGTYGTYGTYGNKSGKAHVEK